MHQALNRPCDLDELLEMILERITTLLHPEEAAIFLKGADGELHRVASRSLIDGEGELFYSRSLTKEVAEKGLAALILDARTDERFAAASSIMSSGVRSVVAAPFLDPEGSLGMIALNSRANVRQFSEDDLDLLVSFASVAALKISNVSLHRVARSRRVRRDPATASLGVS